ncbi:MAG: PHP-associated domain-containing protein [Candidatus Acidiferrales bacterium]
MDLVTLTDHDSIDGAELLRRHSDFFLSEEATCRMPGGTLVHIGVYDITERQHFEIQRRREDLISLLVYLSERRIFFSVNHVFSGLTGARLLEDFDWFREYFPAFETFNGQMMPDHNRHADRLARREGKIRLGGSDSHALRSAGCAWTEAPGARDKYEFLNQLRAGIAFPGGEHGNYFKLTRDVISIVSSMVREKPLSALLLPLALFVPMVTMATALHEIAFLRSWSSQVFGIPARLTRQERWSPGPAAEAFQWP